MTQARVWRRDLAPEIPADVDAPSSAKARGVVTLPQRVNWSEEDATYDLGDRRQRAMVYEQVMSEGAAEDVRYYIDIDVLIDLWNELVLPRAVSQAWIDWIAAHRDVQVSDWRDPAARNLGALRA